MNSDKISIESGRTLVGCSEIQVYKSMPNLEDDFFPIRKLNRSMDNQSFSTEQNELFTSLSIKKPQTEKEEPKVKVP